MATTLKLSDLMSRRRSSSRLMNVKIPAEINDAIERVARDMGASKTEVVVALLNEGLSVSAVRLGGAGRGKAD